MDYLGKEKNTYKGKEVADIINRLLQLWKIKKSKLELYYCKNPSEVITVDPKTFVSFDMESGGIPLSSIINVERQSTAYFLYSIDQKKST